MGVDSCNGSQGRFVRVVSIAAVASAVLGTAAACSGVASGDRNLAEAPSVAPGALHAVPGFGISTENMIRDDAIALYEEYQRDLITRACMESAGHEWQIEVLYPATAVVAVADFLDVEPRGVDQYVSGSEMNSELRASLSSSSLDSYWRSLVGESAADMAYVAETDAVPEGRDADSFARGGCQGSGWLELPGLWAFRDAQLLVRDQYRNEAIAQLEPDDPAFRAVAQCLEENGAIDIDTPLEAFGPRSSGEVGIDLTLDRAIGDCHEVFEAMSSELTNAADSRLYDERFEEFEAHIRSYEGVLANLRQDQGFLDFVALVSGNVAIE